MKQNQSRACLKLCHSRTNLGNARTLNNDQPDNIVRDLDLTGQRYSTIVAIFFVPYVLFEFPSNLLLKRFTPSKWIARIMVSWGIVTCATAAVSSYEGLIVCRVFLGIAEAGFFPGIICYLCFWYKPSERATRMAIFASFVAVSGAFGGLIAAGVGKMHGLRGLSGWQWLFILEGIPAILWGILIYFFLPDYPETAKFLTAEERAFATERMGPFAPKGTDKHFDWEDLKQTVASPMFWLFALQYFLMTNSLNAFGFFAPTIVAALGFKGTNAQLLTVPPNVFALIVIIANSRFSDYSKKRPQFIIAGLLLTAIGYLLLAVVRNWGVRYLGVFFIACTNAGVIPFLAYRTATVTGATSTAIATGGVIAIANIAGITAPYLFGGSENGPLYIRGNWTVFAFLVVAVGMTCYLWFKLGSSSEYRTPVRDDSSSEDAVAVQGENLDKDKL